MKIFDEDFDKLEREIAALFHTPMPEGDGESSGERISRILERANVKDVKDAPENGLSTDQERLKEDQVVK